MAPFFQSMTESVKTTLKTTWKRVKFISITIGVLGGGLAIANLPIPFIRQPIAKQAPFLLLPSLVAWDHHYREGTVALQQAQQLIQQAKHPDDLTLGDRQLKMAQHHLNALPLEDFSQYDASYYCSIRSCSWRFSSQEIQQRRESAARIEATLVQERHLQSQLQQTTDSIAEDQVNYQKATSEAQKQPIVTQWQQDIQQLEALSSNTLTGKLARVEKAKAETAFQNATGFSHNQKRSGNLIQAAKQFALSAQTMSKGASHSTTEWQTILNQWDSAIAQVQAVQPDNPDYISAHKSSVDYQQQRGRVKVRMDEEQKAITQLQTTEAQINSLVRSYSGMNRDQAKAEMMSIEARLNQIPVGTTSYAQAQEWLVSLRKRLG